MKGPEGEKKDISFSAMKYKVTVLSITQPDLS